jgi:hypothetical protein
VGTVGRAECCGDELRDQEHVFSRPPSSVFCYRSSSDRAMGRIIWQASCNNRGPQIDTRWWVSTRARPHEPASLLVLGSVSSATTASAMADALACDTTRPASLRTKSEIPPAPSKHTIGNPYAAASKHTTGNGSSRELDTKTLALR